VTVVPALIPTFIKGRLHREEDNWIVNSFIKIYKPLLTWFLPRRNLVMWMFSLLLILAAGIFPVQAIFGFGASENAWRIFFLLAFAVVVSLTVIFTRGFLWQTLSFASLFLLAVWAFHLPKIGVSFMPALDEGTTLDMPITVPRVGVNQSRDDLKHRDGLLRGFPEVESVIGKAGRADTPTDPAPLDMYETLVNYRPKALWPKRVLKFDDAAQQTRAVLRTLEEEGFVAQAQKTDVRDGLINDATQKALERFDETMRELGLLRYRKFEVELGPLLTRFVVEDTIRRFNEAGDLPGLGADGQKECVDRFTKELKCEYGFPLARNPAVEDVTRITQYVAKELAKKDAFPVWFEFTEMSLKALQTDGVAGSRLTKLKGKKYTTEADFLQALGTIFSEKELRASQAKLLKHGRMRLEPSDALSVKENTVRELISLTGEFLGATPKTFAGEVLKAVEAHRVDLWRERVHEVNGELFDRGVEAYTWYALEELIKGARGEGFPTGAPRGAEADRFSQEAIKARLEQGTAEPDRAKLQKDSDRKAFEPFQALRQDLEKPFKSSVFFWQRQSGPKGDLVDDEMSRVLQVPGWSNIFTQPIINRIEMLSTGVRTDIGLKVFGPDLVTIERTCKDIEAALKPITGARDTIAAPIMGKGYLEIDIDREKAARYGITVEDIQNEIEVALGGRVVTYTVEKLDRLPVRIRYSRVNREDEESVRRLLISPGSMATPAPMAILGKMTPAMGMPGPAPVGNESHQAAPGHAPKGKAPVPLSSVATVRIVEGPAMIKSENGRLMNYVTLNVRGRDIVGFVDEAKRTVAQKVQLPEGVHIAWSGEFEHQVRAAQTLRFVFPVVIVLIFVILYLTYKDLADAVLMMFAVPEALAGGAFFLFLYPKIRYGWDTPPWDFSVAVWVGFIACFGMATETGIIMLVYMREAIEKRGGLENIKSLEELRQAVIEGAVQRLRPKLLTEGVAIIAIFPMVFATGVGGEILAPMALPVLGGLLISDEVVDIFLPVRFYWVRRARWLKLQKDRTAAAKVQAAAEQKKALQEVGTDNGQNEVAAPNF
ncbi:MAG: efflux RND transporter permease subunit, partial [Planctomycetes bacterium]|nr:efflux RND transporter permease subunit [Planctomycetota bacterium]